MLTAKYFSCKKKQKGRAVRFNLFLGAPQKSEQPQKSIFATIAFAVFRIK
jgi:hypothetical protein